MGGFNLQKWSSNSNELLESIPQCDREIKTIHLMDFDDTIKSLGILWNPCTDQFTFQSTLDPAIIATTKRTILSEMSKLFDPLGWVSPLIIRAKILMQEIWLSNVTWDDALPSPVIAKWRLIRNDLQRIDVIALPRSLSHSLHHPIDLHGFSDASTHAFAAVVYARTIQEDGSIIVHSWPLKLKSPLLNRLHYQDWNYVALIFYLNLLTK